MSDVLLMLLADARLPAGAHTQSGGLEPALRDGMPVADIPGYLRARLRTVVAVEAGTAVVARHLAVHGGDLGAVDLAWRARTASKALRDTAERLGRGYRRLVTQLWPDHPAVAVLPQKPCRAVVLGVAAAAAGLAPDRLAALVGYDDAQTVAAAALKIAPMDPVVATRWVVDLADDIDAMTATVAGLTDPREIPAGTAPGVERWAELQTAAPARLFQA
jgi:urease accessory protein